MKTIIILTLTAMLMLAGCFKEFPCTHGQGSIEQVTLNLDEITSVNLQGSMDVEISYGPVQEVVAEGQLNIIDELETSVVNGTWYVSLGTGCFTDFDLKIFIRLPRIEKTVVSGSGNITLIDVAGADAFSAESRGSGRTVITAVDGSQEINVNISGSGDIEMEGLCPELEKLNVTISGSGSFLGYPALTPECTVKSSGSGACKVNVSDWLNVRISGSGNVYYQGNPDIDVDDNGSGKLIRKN